MNRKALSSVMMSAGLTVVISAYGCSRDASRANQTADKTTTGQPAAAGADRAGTPGSVASAAAANGAAADENNARPPISVAGCLQKGDGRSDYILTGVSTPRTSVGTSGTKPANGDLVAQEHMREAAHSYKLAGDRDTLEPLVGHQVRVTGTVERRSDLNDHNADGTLKQHDRTKLDEDDLASVHVDSVDQLAASCGAARAPRGAKKR